MEDEAAGSVVVRWGLDGKQYSAEMQKMISQTKQFKAATAEAGIHTVSQMQAASGAIRLVEGGMNGSIRAAERFVSMIPGVGKALQAAFPLIGGLAFSALLLKVGKEVVDFKEKVDNMPKAIQQGFNSLNLSAMETNDALALTNDKLEEQIAALEGTPVNNLARTLDEARESADKLAKALLSANKEMADLMKENHISAIGNFVSNQATTGSVEGSIKSYNDKISDLGVAKAMALQDRDTTKAADLDKQIRDTQRSAQQWSVKRLGQLGWAQKFHAATLGILPDQAGKMRDVSGFKLRVGEELRGETETDRHQRDKSKLDADEKAAKKKKEADAAAKKLAEEHKRAAELAARAQAKLNRDSDAFAATARASSRGEEWLHRDSKPKTATEIVKAAAAKRKAEDAQQAGAMGAIAGGWMNPGADPKHGERMAELEDRRRLNAIGIMYSGQRTQVNQQARTGQISEHEAALSHAAINAAEFKAQMDVYTAQLARVNAITGNDLSVQERQSKTKEILNQQEEAVGRRNLEVVQERIDAYLKTPRGAAQQASTDYLKQFDGANMAANLTGGTMSTVNDHVAQLMSTGKGNFSGMFRELSGMAAKNALGGMENKISKLFGGKGKLGESAANAMWVKMADKAAAVAATLPGAGMETTVASLKNLVPGGSGGGAGGAFQGVMGALGSVASLIPGGSIISGILSHFPKFASGGAISTGLPAIVGENGPELFMPHTSGRIVPNHDLGGGGQTIHVDARGATDPAATAMAVRRAIRETAQATEHRSMVAQHEKTARTVRR